MAATLQVSQEEVGKDMGADAEAKNSVLKCLQVWNINVNSNILVIKSWILNARKGVRSGWSEPAATNAPVQDEVIQAVLGMNQKHILFPCPRIFQPSSLPQKFPLLPPSPHFSLTPSPELGRAP